MNPKSTDALARFSDFSQILLGRLEVGRDTYGDASFFKSDPALVEEISQELLDVCGWSYIMWTKLQNLKASIEGLQAGAKAAPSPTTATTPYDDATPCGCI